MFDALQHLTVPRDSVDFRRASAIKSLSIQDTYRRFHAFIDILMQRLQSPGSLLDMTLIDTLDGIKRGSTVNLFNLYVRAGKLTEVENAEEG